MSTPGEDGDAPRDETAGEWVDDVICPYCGEPWGESFDYPRALRRGDPVQLACDECGRAFRVEAEFTATYRATPVESA